MLSSSLVWMLPSASASVNAYRTLITRGSHISNLLVVRSQIISVETISSQNTSNQGASYIKNIITSKTGSALLLPHQTISFECCSMSTLSSAVKRSLEGASSPPAKYRLVHNVAGNAATADDAEQNEKKNLQKSESQSDQNASVATRPESSFRDNQQSGSEGMTSSDTQLNDSSCSMVLDARLDKSDGEISVQSDILSKIDEQAELLKSFDPKFKGFCKMQRFKMLNENAANTHAQSKQAHKNLATYIAEQDDDTKHLGSDATVLKIPMVNTHHDEPALELQPDPQSVEVEEAMKDGLLAERKKKKMFAIFLSYSGKGYSGLQFNGDVPTIEREVVRAMVATGLMTKTESTLLQSICLQRAARTDKGVSAARQVLSAKLPIEVGQEEQYVSEVNKLLPEEIRMMDLRRATRGFNSKNWCDFRTYSYLTPTYAFAPLESITNNEFRISEEGLKALRKLLKMYCGTRNFHNFTSRKKPTEANAKRVIFSMEACDPFVREEVEWLHIKIKGQSFMMHQIRKMIGLVMTICRGLNPSSVLLHSFSHDKVETPKAPGLGLVLEQPHYDGYNKKFGQDGQHQPIDWDHLTDKVEQFRRDYIDRDIVQTELAEGSMMNFIKLLHMYASTSDSTGKALGGVGRAYKHLTGLYPNQKDADSSNMHDDDDEDADDGPDDGGAVDASDNAVMDDSNECVVSDAKTDGVSDAKTDGVSDANTDSAVDASNSSVDAISTSDLNGNCDRPKMDAAEESTEESSVDNHSTGAQSEVQEHTQASECCADEQEAVKETR